MISRFFTELEARGIRVPSDLQQRIRVRLDSIISYEPRIGILGKSGVGKSSLCNALFGRDVCEISDIEACTRNPQEVYVRIASKGIRLVDVPGVGESRSRDREYAELYKAILPTLDAVLWVLKADDRAMTIDEDFYRDIVSPVLGDTPFLVVLNQVDKIEPYREWKVVDHVPGPNQLENIGRKTDWAARHFGVAADKVIAVSASESYNLTGLVDALIHSLPSEKKIVVLRDVAPKWVSDRTKEEATKSFWYIFVDLAKTFVSIGPLMHDMAIDVTKWPIWHWW